MAEPMRVLFVCLGNICRSPMAEGLLLHKLKQRGIEHRFEVDSCGTAAYHVGELADRRTRAELRRHGAPMPGTSRQVVSSDFERFDVILAMDRSNRQNLLRICPQDAVDRVYLMLAPLGGGEVPDPYYGGPQGFELVYGLLDEALDAWLSRWQP